MPSLSDGSFHILKQIMSSRPMYPSGPKAYAKEIMEEASLSEKTCKVTFFLNNYQLNLQYSYL